MPLSKITSNSISTAETFQSFSTGGVERLRIDATGNVSIGTTTTAVKFNVYSATNPLVANFDTGSASGSYIRFQNSGTSIGDLGSGVNLFGGGGYALDFGLTSRTGGNLVFGTASTERMRINSGGNIGIGVVPSISARRLTVYGSSSSAAVSSLVIQTSTSGTTASDGFSMELDGTTAYLWNYENAPLLFGTNNATRMTITNDGNIGFGITPGGFYSLQSQTGFNTGFKGFNFGLLAGGASSSGYPVVGYNVRFTGTANVYQYNAPDYANIIDFQSGNFRFLGASIGVAGNNVAFTEYARFDASGHFLLAGTTASLTSGTGIKLFWNSTSPYVGVVNVDSTNSSSNYHLYSTGAGAYRFYVGLGGTVYATSTTISAVSDIRLKENIRDLNVGLNEIMQLKPRLFDWKPGKGLDVKNARGFIAQEFETVFPDLIDTWKDEPPEGEEPYKSVKADLIPVLVKAIQELKAEFDEYKATHP